MPTEKHHDFGGSSLSRRELCPFSYKAEKGKPSIKNKNSEKGEKQHKAIESRDLSNLTKSERDEVIWAEEKVIEILEKYKRIVEVRQEPYLEIKHKNEVLNYGSADVLALVENWDGEMIVVVIDFKFGRNFVSAYDNIQLESYGVAGCQVFKKNKCDYYIIQPPLESISRGSFDDVLIPLERIKKVIDSCKVENPPANPSEKACMWCKARSTCQYVEEVQMAVEKYEPKDILSMSPSEVAETIDKIAIVKSKLKRMEEEINLYAEKNNGIDGFYQWAETKGKAKPIDIKVALNIVPIQNLINGLTVSQTAIQDAYVNQHYKKGENTKKALKDAVKAKLQGNIKYNAPTRKLKKIGG